MQATGTGTGIGKAAGTGNGNRTGKGAGMAARTGKAAGIETGTAGAQEVGTGTQGGTAGTGSGSAAGHHLAGVLGGRAPAGSGELLSMIMVSSQCWWIRHTDAAHHGTVWLSYHAQYGSARMQHLLLGSWDPSACGPCLIMRASCCCGC